MHATDCLSPAARALTLEVLALASWADGRVSPAELSAARGAAIALALLGPLDGACGALVARPRALAELDFGALTTRERQLVLAAAAWMTLVDAKRTPAEGEWLDELARRAELDDETAELLFDVAYWVRLVRPRGATWAHEFDRLIRVTDGALGPARPPAALRPAG
ncbi:MAG TPA: hypothetical protein VFS43_37900 [Polyangiaceae bacterium]|nr:hypothetical protein [Polyangiaceae bacterium]